MREITEVSMLDAETAKNVLVEVINFIQEASGRPLCTYQADFCPLSDLPGFDSLNGIEAGVALATRLGVELEENPLKDPNSGRARTFAQVTKILTVTPIA